jgi:stage II sporulation SpoE-like protein
LAATFPKSGPRKLPLTLGLLRITGATLDGPQPTDFFDVTSGPGGDVGVVLLDLRLRHGDPSELALAIAGRAAQGFRERTPLHAIMLDLSRALLRHAVVDLRVTLIRCSAADARAEITTAGMPPVACVHPDGHITLHGVASQPLTTTTIAPPPVEVVPLVWGSNWLVLSDGFTADQPTTTTTSTTSAAAPAPVSAAATAVRRIAEHLVLAEEGLLLSQQTPEILQALLLKRVPVADRSASDDASIILMAADPSARSESGIQRAKQDS